MPLYVNKLTQIVSCKTHEKVSKGCAIAYTGNGIHSFIRFPEINFTDIK